MIRELLVAVVGDDEDGHVGVGDHPFGEAVEEEAARAAAAVVADDDEVEAVLVRVAEMSSAGLWPSMITWSSGTPTRSARSATRGERLLEVAAGGVDRLGAVGLGLGVGR